MSLTEANTIQEYILKILQKLDWEYLPPESIQRKDTDILLKETLAQKLQDLNPEIKEEPQRAHEVIYQLEKIIHTTQDGLIKANEEFSKWLKGDKTMRYGQNNQDVSIKLIDFDNIQNNTFQITKEYSVKSPSTGKTKRPDIILFVNGIPLVDIETKSPVRESQTWADGASQVSEDYESSIPELFASNVFNAATEGKEVWYGAVGSNWEDFWEPWKKKDRETSKLTDIKETIESLFNRVTVLEMLQWYTIFSTNPNAKKIKMIARYPQYEATNLITQRVIENKIKRGLIWHFQGSGKSLLMILAAMRLRQEKKLENPTIIIVVDRIDLDTQISGKFNAANVPNTIPADSRAELAKLLKQDTRKVIITTIHKFGEAEGVLNDRDNIIVLVDEADRTQEGELGQKMRDALPNAFLFGLTGTPVNKKDRNTFLTFGAKEDGDARYLHRYSFEESVEDHTTLEINFETVPAEYKFDKKEFEEAYALIKTGTSVSEESIIASRAARLHQFLISSNVIEKKAKTMIEHFSETIEPAGFKAMIVAHNRESCVKYKDAVDKLLPKEASEVVMTLNRDDPKEWYQRFDKTREQLDEIQKQFNNPNNPLKILIVTQKLMRGFDAPILQVMYLDKMLKDQGLLQAVCRVNRPTKGKLNGIIVDYIGVFDNVSKALTYDYEKISNVVKNLEELADELPDIFKRASSYFVNLDRNLEGFELLAATQECLEVPNDSAKSIVRKESFATDFVILNKFWEKLHPRYTNSQQVKEYKFLYQIYTSIARSKGSNVRIWKKLGPKTEQLIQDNIDVTLRDDLEVLVMDENLIRKIKEGLKPYSPKSIEIKITRRINRDPNNPKFIEIAEKLEKLKEKYNQKLIDNKEFLKELIDLARSIIEIEKDAQQITESGKKNALTRIFEKAKTPSKEIEKIVEEIDQIISKERYDGWQNTVTGTKLIQQKLYRIVYTHKLDDDVELFEKAYNYIKEHY